MTMDRWRGGRLLNWFLALEEAGCTYAAVVSMLRAGAAAEEDCCPVVG